MFIAQLNIPFFVDRSGRPLDGGYLYFGEENLNPETNPIVVYWDQAGTQPAAQPVRTSNGYPVRAGTPAMLFAPTNYSLTIKNVHQELVAYLRSSANVGNASTVQYGSNTLDELLLSGIDHVIDSIDDLRDVDKTLYTRCSVSGYTAAGDGGGGMYWYDSTDTTSADNGGTIIVADDGGRWKLYPASTVYVEQFGAIGDAGNTGASGTDDTDAFQAAIDWVAPNGTVRFSGQKRYLIDNNLVIKQGVTLASDGGKPGANGLYNATWYQSLGGVLFVNGSFTVTLQASAGIKGGYIFRKGLSVPAADVSLFVGTAITIPDMTGPVGATDTTLTECMILGFDRAWNGTGNTARIVATDVLFDCLNGPRTTNAGDPLKYTRVHGWPFATVGGAGTTARSGKCFEFQGNHDGAMVSDCFGFGYDSGVFCEDGCPIFSKVNMDGGAVATGSAWTFNGAHTPARAIQCNAAGYARGLEQNADNTSDEIEWIDGLISTITDDAVYSSKGTINIRGGRIVSADQGITLASVDTILKLNGVHVEAITNNAVNNPFGGEVQIGDDNYFNDNVTQVYSGPAQAEQIASAATIALPRNGKFFELTGTDSVTLINGGWPGRVVTLYSSSACAVNASANIHMTANHAFTAGNSLNLIFNDSDNCWGQRCG